jgi:hypothetical protein
MRDLRRPFTTNTLSAVVFHPLYCSVILSTRACHSGTELVKAPVNALRQISCIVNEVGTQSIRHSQGHGSKDPTYCHGLYIVVLRDNTTPRRVTCLEPPCLIAPTAAVNRRKSRGATPQILTKSIAMVLHRYALLATTKGRYNATLSSSCQGAISHQVRVHHNHKCEFITH